MTEVWWDKEGALRNTDFVGRVGGCGSGSVTHSPMF